MTWISVTQTLTKHRKRTCVADESILDKDFALPLPCTVCFYRRL